MKHRLSAEDLEMPDAKRHTSRLLQLQIEDFISERQLSSHEINESRRFALHLIDYISKLSQADNEHDHSAQENRKRLEGVETQGVLIYELTEELSVSDTSELSKKGIEFPLHLPFGRKLSDIRSSRGCQWISPERFLLLSDHLLGLTTKEDPALDVDIVIPLKYFGSRDFLNFAYQVKRAHYACHLASELHKCGYIVQFSSEQRDAYRPILVVSKHNSVLRLHFSPADGFAKPCRFRPQNNNLRSSFCLGASDTEPPTPYYSANILSDLVRRQLDRKFKKFLEEKPNFVKAIFMIRAWMQSRRFTKRPDGFSNALITAWLVYLYRGGLVAKSSATIDIIAAFFKSIGNALSVNWKEARLSLAKQIDESLFDQFNEQFNFVFVDYSGYLNLARALSVAAWDNIRDAAERSLEKLDDFNEFDSLFTVERPFHLSFDLYIKVLISKNFVVELLRPTHLKELISRCDDWSRIAVDRITTLMKRAWAGRAAIIDIDVQMGCDSDKTKFDPGRQTLRLADEDTISSDIPEKWDLSCKPVDLASRDLHLALGVRLLPGWESTVTRGPPAKTPEAVEFRAFWGEISELRKFPDNAICEAVVWGADANSPRVPFQICQHILSRHMKLKRECIEERSVFSKDILPPLTDRYERISRAFDKLSKTLRVVNELPLLITNIAPVSCFLRGTSPYPPPPSHCIIEGSSLKVVNQTALPLRSSSPHFLPTVEVHLTLEQSGKWGEDLEAIARLKTAFYNAMCKILNDKFLMRACPYDTHALVVVDDVIFRLLISYEKEVHIMRKLAAGRGGHLKDTIETRMKEREVVLQTSLAAHLQRFHEQFTGRVDVKNEKAKLIIFGWYAMTLMFSVSQQFASFAPACRLALKWLSSQMLSDFIEDIMVETIMASVFLRPFTSYQPRTPFMAFAHFLRLLSSHSWLLRPLLVDFNNEWNDSDIDAMQKDFVKMRPVLPAMVICIPEDRTGCRYNNFIFAFLSDNCFLFAAVQRRLPLHTIKNIVFRCLFVHRCKTDFNISFTSWYLMASIMLNIHSNWFVIPSFWHQQWCSTCDISDVPNCR
ncbi:unnamed protein product [Toxocara canis]|uniref:Nucleolar protein 6 n=1 Tax=Toxocara canis TaxID=6265 RepID=A0A183UBI2_TOXCA|nr:unnamed protein product [Toxocara canis]